MGLLIPSSSIYISLCSSYIMSHSFYLLEYAWLFVLNPFMDLSEFLHFKFKPALVESGSGISIARCILGIVKSLGACLRLTASHWSELGQLTGLFTVIARRGHHICGFMNSYFYWWSLQTIAKITFKNLLWLDSIINVQSINKSFSLLGLIVDICFSFLHFLWLFWFLDSTHIFHCLFWNLSRGNCIWMHSIISLTPL